MGRGVDGKPIKNPIVVRAKYALIPVPAIPDLQSLYHDEFYQVHEIFLQIWILVW